jgi:hypothetical protein
MLHCYAISNVPTESIVALGGLPPRGSRTLLLELDPATITAHPRKVEGESKKVRS